MYGCSNCTANIHYICVIWYVALLVVLFKQYAHKYLHCCYKVLFNFHCYTVLFVHKQCSFLHLICVYCLNVNFTSIYLCTHFKDEVNFKRASMFHSCIKNIYKDQKFIILLYLASLMYVTYIATNKYQIFTKTKNSLYYCIWPH